jgi:hypothetical protein
MSRFSSVFNGLVKGLGNIFRPVLTFCDFSVTYGVFRIHAVLKQQETSKYSHTRY